MTLSAAKRWIGRTALTTALAVGLTAAGLTIASPAVAAGTYPTLAASNIRAGANTGSAILVTVPKGTRLTIDCYVRGQSVSGTTIWNRVPQYNGFISDSLLLTGSANPVVPQCGTAPAPAPAPAPASTREDRAVAWATGQIGSNAYTTVTTSNGKTVLIGWCLKFVANAYGKPAAGFPTAMDMFSSLQRSGQIRTGTPPKGALVFSKSSYDGGAGHVAIATGDGRYIMGGIDPTRVIGGRKASVNIFSTANPSSGAVVLGWAYAPSGWVG